MLVTLNKLTLLDMAQRLDHDKDGYVSYRRT